MARLTFDAVQAYATECGYELFIDADTKEKVLTACGVQVLRVKFNYPLAKIQQVIKTGEELGYIKNKIGHFPCSELSVVEVTETDYKGQVTELVNRINDVWDKFAPKDDEIDVIIKIARALSTLNSDCRDNDWHNRPVQMPSHLGFWEYAWECFNKYRVIEECKPILKSHGIGCYHRHISCAWVGDVIARKHGQQKRLWWQDAHKPMTDIQYWNAVKELLAA